MSTSRQGLVLNLLKINSTIGTEAAAFFYGRNAFAFRQDHEWVNIISWLTAIGMRNRTLLRHLIVSVDQPTLAWQLPNGSRGRLCIHRDEFWPRNANLSHTSYPVPEGEVENISPVIEGFIALLARSENDGNVAPLRLTLDLQSNLIPGPVVLLRPRHPFDHPDDDEYHGYYVKHWSKFRWFTMNMPNLMEKWRAEYTTGAGCRPVEILWNIETDGVRMEEKRVMIVEKGWEITEEETLETTWPRFDPDLDPKRNPPRFNMVRLLLRRTPIFGPLIAADPCPWGDATGSGI